MHQRHRDIVKKIDGDFPVISNKGGSTTITVTAPSGASATGKAVCSLEDNFNHRIGNSIALGRALQQLTVKEAMELMAVNSLTR
jgi:hypothetical protein